MLKEIDISEMLKFFERVMLDMTEEKIRTAFTRKIALAATSQEKKSLGEVRKAIAAKGGLVQKCSALLEMIGKGEAVGEEAENTGIRFLARTLFGNDKLFHEKSPTFTQSILGLKPDKLQSHKELIDLLKEERKKFFASVYR